MDGLKDTQATSVWTHGYHPAADEAPQECSAKPLPLVVSGAEEANGPPDNGHASSLTDPGAQRTAAKLQRKLSSIEARLNPAASTIEEGVSSKNFNKAWMYPELQWGITPDLSVRKDYAWFLNQWEVLTALACLYVGFMVPFTLGFEKYYFADGEQCLFSSNAVPSNGTAFYVTRIVDIIVDLIFIVDIFINFVSARWVFRLEPMAHWTLVDDLSKIAQLYMSDMFVLDVLGSLPVQHLDCIEGVNAGFLKFARLLRLFKLFRLTRLATLISLVQRRFPSSIYVVAFIELFVYFFLVAHWTACIFFWIAFGLAHPNGDEYERYLFENGWVGPNKDGTLDENGEKPEHGPEPWISAMYWAVTTMSTIGYGDISPGTLPERILGMFLMCIGCAFFAWITGKITQLMTEKHACQTRFDETLEDLEAFMTQRVLPVALRERIRNYYKVRFPNKQVFDESAIISDIEAPALKKEIVLHLYRDVVASVPIFRILHSETQKEICFRLQSRYRMPGRVVTIAGTVPDSMYVIRFGQVSIKTSGERNFVAQQGDLFGELAIMGLTPNGLRMRTAIAVTVCELCEFSKEDFWELLTTQRGFLHMICKVTRMHLLRLKHNFAIAKQFLEDKTGPRPEHFWDLMGHIEWKSICQLLQAEGEGDRRREENAKLDPIKIEQIESQTGKTMLLTSFRMQLNSIGPVTTNNPHHLHVIVMKWPGIPNLPLTAAGNETKTFVLQEEIEDKEDHYEIQRDIEIPVIYPHGLIWKDLEPLTIQVLSYPDDDDVQQSVLSDLSRRMSSPKRASAVSVTADVVKHDMSGGSLVHPSAKTLYVGQVHLQDLVRNRGRIVGRKSFHVSLTCLASQAKPVQLEITCDVRRKPQSPLWAKILHNINGRGSSKYFINKLEGLLSNIMENEDDFVTENRDKRLQIMAAFRDKQTKVAAALNTGHDDYAQAAGAPKKTKFDKPAGGTEAVATGASEAIASLQDMMHQMLVKMDHQTTEFNAFKDAVTTRLDQQSSIIEALRARTQTGKVSPPPIPPPPSANYMSFAPLATPRQQQPY